MMVRQWAGKLLPGVLLVVAGCGGTSGPHEGDAPKASALVEIEAASMRPVSATLSAYGTVEFQPERTKSIAAQFEAVVERVFITAGQPVKAGDSLVELRASVGARLESERAAADAEFARAGLARTEALRKQQLATNMELSAARRDAATAEAALQAARSRSGRGATLVLSSPLTGVVADVSTEPGVVAGAGSVLVRVAPGDALRIRLGIEPADLPAVRPGLAVQVQPLQGQGPALAGRLTQIARRVDPQTHLADAFVLIDTPGALLPGSMVRAEIQLRASGQSLTVPRAAVLYEGARAYVFVADGAVAQRRWIEAGRDDGIRVEVARGVVAGESVVIVGNYQTCDTLEAVSAQIVAADLQVGNVQGVGGDPAPDWLVEHQDPAPGEAVPPGTPIDLIARNPLDGCTAP